MSELYPFGLIHKAEPWELFSRVEDLRKLSDALYTGSGTHRIYRRIPMTAYGP
jgi:hypothetical protein